MTRKLEDLIVTVRPTIQDGPVVDWFTSEAAAYDVRRAIVSASRNEVRIECSLDDLPDGLLDTARQVQQACKRGARTADLEAAYATHDGSWGRRELTRIVKDGQLPQVREQRLVIIFHNGFRAAHEWARKMGLRRREWVYGTDAAIRGYSPTDVWVAPDWRGPHEVLKVARESLAIARGLRGEH